MNIPYLNCDLFIEKTEDGYWVRLLDSPAGQATAEFLAPFQAKELDPYLQWLAEPAIADLERQQAKRLAMQEMGSRLFQALWRERLESCFRNSMAIVFQQRARLRIRLRMSATPELWRLPWEYLYDPIRQEFASLSVHTPVVRYIDLMHRALPFALPGPLRALVVIANPIGLPALQVERQWLNFIDSVDQLGIEQKMTFERLERPTLLELQRRLRQGEYHLLYFIGHSQYDEERREGSLVFEDEQRRPRPINGEHLGGLLNDHFSLRLAVLSAYAGVHYSIQTALINVAQALVWRGLPAVAAMQFALHPTVTHVFDRHFLREIAEKRPVDAAMAEARRAMATDEQATDWGAPVLITRIPDGQLFTTKAAPAAVQRVVARF